MINSRRDRTVLLGQNLRKEKRKDQMQEKRDTKISNYEQCCSQWANKFLSMDHQRLQNLLPELRDEGEYFTIYHFAKKYKISKSTGEIFQADTGEKPSTTLQFNIYTLFAYVSPQAYFHGDWQPFANMRNARPFGPAFQKGVIEAFAATFSGHLKELQNAAERLGGERLHISDAGYRVKAFECIPICFHFWDRDEEFDAQANILFDAGAVDYIHVESLVSIATQCLYSLAEEAGLPVSGRSFQTS